MRRRVSGFLKNRFISVLLSRTACQENTDRTMPGDVFRTGPIYGLNSISPGIVRRPE